MPRKNNVLTPPHGTASGDLVELSIDKVVFGGDGLAHREGKVYLVPDTLPGEKILARVTDEKKNYSRAAIARVLAPSPHRITPACRYATHCGGCRYQHVVYAEELRLKESQLVEILVSIPGILAEKILPIVSSGKEYGYRNGVTLHPIFSKKNKGAILGLIGKDNVSRIAVQSCLLADPRLLPVFGKGFSIKKNVESAAFKLSESGDVVSDGFEIFFRVKLGDESFLAASRGFFQANLETAGLLAEKIRAWMARSRPRLFFDLYAGVGIFSILCAKGAEKIVCIEESPASVQALRMNREEKKMSSMEILEGRVEKIFPEAWKKEKRDPSLVLMDPPRQGIAPALARFLSEGHGIGALAYVSCDPVTLARDLKILLSGGYWEVQEIVPFDFFPRTKHLETAVFLTRR